ncbi:MAG: DUF1972 domain-containing protein [Lapillicoccus sp.]
MEQRAGEPRAARLTIAMLGTRGVPARYGGFETAVEEVGQRLASRGHDVRVYCREGPDAPRPTQYKGMQLVWLPALHRRSMETLSHTGASVAHLLAAPTDVAFVFNCANAAWLPALRAARIPVATHVDGLEWKRAKWGGAGRRYYRIAEAGAVRLSDALIADAPGIADYYREEFDAPTELISYGSPVLCDVGSERLAEVGVRPQDYHLVVARLEPENHVDLMVDGFMRSRSPRQLVVVGSAPYADEYSARVHALAGSDPRVRFLGGVWDQVLLDQLYAHAFTYLHGHSVGGTNPSLLRAIGVGTPCVAYDVSFNRDVLEDEGVYVGDRIAVTAAIEAAEADPVGTAARGARLLERAKHYDWDEVADAYENLAWALAEHHTPGPHRGGRRHHTRHLPMSADPSPAHVGRRG